MRKLAAALSTTERVLILLAAVAAVWSWVELERSADVGPGILGYVGAFFALGLLGSAARCATEGVDATVARLRSGQRYDPQMQQLQALCIPRAAVWLLPIAITPILAATLPIAFATAPGDWSILGVLALFVGLVSYVGLLLGFLVWILVVLPLFLLGRVIGRRARGVSTDDNDRFAAAFGVLLLSVVIFAVALVSSTPSAAGSRQERNGGRLAALVGLGDERVEPGWLMWLARVALVAIVASVVLIVRISRSRRTQ